MNIRAEETESRRDIRKSDANEHEIALLKHTHSETFAEGARAFSL